MDGNLDLFEFCVFSQRLGASRGMTWKTWKRFNPEAVTFAGFVATWKAALAAEELGDRYPGLRQP